MKKNGDALLNLLQKEQWHPSQRSKAEFKDVSKFLASQNKKWYFLYLF